jgi:23S rRNA (cytidine1920-2'-O)/16S rRNA (cytidine1409-2'-O)-methyltransferase
MYRPETAAGKRRRKVRLDELLVERGLVPSRARARDLIRRGLVSVAGVVQVKPAASVGPSATITVSACEAGFVSRGATKLNAALDYFRFHCAGVVALDIGAGTGGFTEVLLERGAARVYAVDVGRDQLHPKLKKDSRVLALETCDARHIDRDLVPEAIGAVVADVSFISLTQVLPAALALTIPKAWLVALIKPQFEAGRNAIGKGGIVRDATAQARAVARVCEWLAQQPGWRVIGVVPSPIAGGSGNREYLLGAIREH